MPARNTTYRFGAERLSLKEIAERTGIYHKTLLYRFRQRGLYDPHDYPYGEGPDVCELLTLHETELVRQIPEDKRSQLQRTMDAIAAESASPSPDPEREKLAADIKAAVAELANGEQYPDLLAAIDQLAAMQQPSAAEGKDRE